MFAGVRWLHDTVWCKVTRCNIVAGNIVTHCPQQHRIPRAGAKRGPGAGDGVMDATAATTPTTTARRFSDRKHTFRYTILILDIQFFCPVIYVIEIVINGVCLCNMDPACQLISPAKSGVLDHKL